MTNFFQDVKMDFDRTVNRPDLWCEGFGLLSYVTPDYYYEHDLRYVGTHVYHECGEMVHVVRVEDPDADDFGSHYYTLHI